MKNFEKQAFWKGLLTILGHAGAGTGYAWLLDQTAHGDDPDPKWTAERKGQFAISALLGALGTGAGHGALHYGLKGEAALAGTLGAASVASLGMAPAKNAAEAIAGNARRATDALEALSKAQGNTAKALQDTADKEGSNTNSWLIGLLGLGALGLGGYGLYKWLKKEDKSQSKMRIKLPGVKGDPNSGAEVEVPINPAKISPGLMSRINSTVLRRTRSNVRYAAKKVDPETGKKIPYEEWVMKYGDEEDREALRQELSETGDKQDEMEQMMEELAQPLPETEGDYEMKEASLIPPGFASALRKAADFTEAEEALNTREKEKQVMAEEAINSRAKHESRGWLWGMLPGSVLGAVLGGMAGDELIGGKAGGTVGRVAGTLLGGIVPWEIGLIAGAHGKRRTQEEQDEHDRGLPWAEYLIPGYAPYQQMMRLRREKGGKKKKEEGQEKKASREGHEFLGATLSSFPSSIAGALTGALLAENSGVNPIVGRVLGGGVGAFLPALIGGGLAAVTKDRTPEEQAAHDLDSPWMEYLIPGYSTYQMNKRNQAERIEKERWKEQMQKMIGSASFAATGQKLPPSFKGGEVTPTTLPLDELVDMKKAGGMAPPPPPGGGMSPPPPGGGMGGPGMPPPPPGQMGGTPPMGGPGMPPPPSGGQQMKGRPTNPSQNLPDQGIPKTKRIENVLNRSKSVNQIVHVSQMRPESMPRTRDIRVRMGRIMDMVRNERMRNRGYGQV